MFTAQEPGAERATATQDESEERPGSALDLRRVLSSVRDGSRWIVAVALVALVVGVVVTRKYVSREYASELSILWEPASADPSAAEDEGRTLRTLADSVKLPVNLAAIRERLSIQQTLERIGRRVDVSASTETRLIVLKATGESPEDARRITQAAADVFLDHRRSLERARLDERLRTIETDAREARSALDAARARYDSFRRLHSIANLPAEQLAAIEHAARLRADADLARAEAEGESAREIALRAAARAQSPLTILSESEQMLGAQRLADSEGQLTAARSRLTDAHPALQALEAQTDALRARAESAVRTGRIIGRNPHWDAYTASAATASAVGSSLRRREEILRSSLRETAARVDELASLDGESATLLASVTVAERHLAEILASRARAQDAQRSPATGLRIVAAAVAPDRPSKSLRRPLMIASPVLGTIISLVILLIRALRGGRAVTPEEVAFWTSAPVLGSIEVAASREATQAVYEDVRATIDRCSGSTLIVALDPAALDMARAMTAVLRGEPSVFQSETRERLDSGPRAKKKRGREKPAESPAPARAPLHVQLWTGALAGGALRRAAREADRVLVVVKSDAHVVTSLAGLRGRFGGANAMACVVVELAPALADRADRVGSTRRFERGERVAMEPAQQPTTGAAKTS